MNNSKKLFLEFHEVNKLSNLAESIYNMCVVADYFCSTQKYIEELYNIAPIIKKIKIDADVLNAFFINLNDK